MTDPRAVDAWWRGLDSPHRDLALSVAVGEALTAELAATLDAAGVLVPRVVVGWDVDGAFEPRTVFVLPHAVADYLEEVRAAAVAAGPLHVVLQLAS